MVHLGIGDFLSTIIIVNSRLMIEHVSNHVASSKAHKNLRLLKVGQANVFLKLSWSLKHVGRCNVLLTLVRTFQTVFVEILLNETLSNWNGWTLIIWTFNVDVWILTTLLDNLRVWESENRAPDRGLCLSCAGFQMLAMLIKLYGIAWFLPVGNDVSSSTFPWRWLLVRVWLTTDSST